MLNFESDYIEGAHPKVLDALVKTNFQALSGYGVDEYSASAKEKIAKACQCTNAQITFITGGTQTNQLVISSMLKQYQGVVAATTGHVSLHEGGAIEYTGHKVLTVPGHEGKMKAEELNQYLTDFFNDGNNEHMVFPGMVYISYPTEYGTLYSKKELEDISKVCKEYKLPLFLDGARLGYGLMSNSCDLSLADIAALCDVFYIGGTKVGALCGEAVVFTKNNEPEHFVNLTKKHGALLAKGRLNGIQFDTLFTDNLYFEISKNAIDMAELMKNGFKSAGYSFLLDSPTNQQFIILENKKMEELSKNVRFCFWEKVDETHTAVRFATSWATTKEKVEELLNLI
ncbi:MAG: aminotransferase class V-fold PLP-dependent enzyme [Treponema sp.]|nr:aminotransferase class V-fold PLP-dependent enzyme [Treponema sp.]